MSHNHFPKIVAEMLPQNLISRHPTTVAWDLCVYIFLRRLTTLQAWTWDKVGGWIRLTCLQVLRVSPVHLSGQAPSHAWPAPFWPWNHWNWTIRQAAGWRWGEPPPWIIFPIPYLGGQASKYMAGHPNSIFTGLDIFVLWYRRWNKKMSLHLLQTTASECRTCHWIRGAYHSSPKNLSILILVKHFPHQPKHNKTTKSRHPSIHLYFVNYVWLPNAQHSPIDTMRIRYRHVKIWHSLCSGNQRNCHGDWSRHKVDISCCLH